MMDLCDNMRNIQRLFSSNLKAIVEKMNINYEQLQEIRLRSNKPMITRYQNTEYFITENGELTHDIKKAYVVKNNEIKETMEYVSNYSMYAYEEEIKQGFITVNGGHRIGICGKTVIENNKIKTMKYISFINMRFSHQVIGCADPYIKYIYRENNDIYNTLIISPPRCGKTTLLRDIVRKISTGEGETSRHGMSVGLVDERSEIASCYLGIPQNDVGTRTDVIDGCPKSLGIMMLIRTMSPMVVAIDEIGCEKDIEAIKYGINCGCRFIGTIHGSSIEEILRKPIFKTLIDNQSFERYIFLNNHSKICNVESICDRNLKKIEDEYD